MVNTENLKRGTAELVILCILKKEDMYGYQIVQELSAQSGNRFVLPLGSLYPIMYRFVESGYVTERNEIVNKRLRKYYHLEESGVKYYGELLDEYKKIADGVKGILQEDV
ncbi:MAG: PadR family transcriptional regulator [Ruminococcus sp.]|nr:PadR family transcriptional regulator [Ruminococcus sp.]